MGDRLRAHRTRGGDQARDLLVHALRHGAGNGEERDRGRGERREARADLPGNAGVRLRRHRRRREAGALGSHMDVTAEIKTSQRRVIRYLFDPAQRSFQEIFRER